MPSFTERMQAGKDAAAHRRQRMGVSGGGKFYNWGGRAAPASEQGEPELFDEFLQNARRRVQAGNEALHFAMLRVREIEIEGRDFDDIPF